MLYTLLRGGTLKYSLIFALALICLSLNSKTFVREYTYKAGEADSKLTSRAIALEQVKRLLLEEVGVYIKSSLSSQETEINGTVSALTQKDIQVLSAGITQTKVLEEKWDGESYRLKAEIQLDEKDVLRQLDDLISNEKGKEILEQNRAATDAALQEIARLKAELEQEKDKNLQSALQVAYTSEVGKLSAVDYYEKGRSYFFGDNSKLPLAAEYFRKAVDADSTFAAAWRVLGHCHKMENNLGSALKCFQKAYDLSKDLEILVLIAECYYDLGEFSRANEYCEGVLKVDPDNFSAVNFGSLIYLSLQEYDKAIACYLRLIELNAEPASMYSSIGDAYSEKGDFASAQDYYLRAVELEPEASYNWAYLAVASFNNGDFQQAIRALHKCLEFDTEEAWAEELLGRSYGMLADEVNSKKYYLLAARHGNESAQDWCKYRNLSW